MIAYRLTGRSPYISLPEDPNQLHQIARRESMSQQLQVDFVYKNVAYMFL
jgi:hypothetical protein